MLKKGLWLTTTFADNERYVWRSTVAQTSKMPNTLVTQSVQITAV